MAQLFLLFEHATGYTLFKVNEYDESGIFLEQLQKSIANVDNFKSLVEFVSFQPFTTGRDALDNMNSVSEGILHAHLQTFLENNLPKSKKKRPVTLGVNESKLASAISEVLGVSCSVSGSVPEIIRGIRFHFHNLVESIRDLNSANKAQLGLGHHYSRARVKFNVNKIDNMIIQSISILDQLDKDINTFSMRIREWYSFHFPELVKIVPENHLYIKCVSAIQNRKAMPEDMVETLENILMDSTKAQNVIELARSSMGMEISPLDLENVTLFAERVSSLITRRKELMEYLKSKMHCVAPNLAVLIGETVGARLIAHAGSLINLAKFPASTVQILGAEKALFRALKTRGNTPKYGLIYHSTFIGRAGKANKGRISRYLANKCSVASRIDCFREIPTEVFGTKLRQQVEDRLKFYETGDIPEKNVDVMTLALAEADELSVVIAKQKRKEEKKAKKRKSELLEKIANKSVNDSTDNIIADPEGMEDVSPKKKKKFSVENSDENNVTVELNSTVEEVEMDEAALEKARKKAAKKAKKLAKMNASQNSLNESINEEACDETSFVKSKKKKLKNQSMDDSNLSYSIGDISMENESTEACNGIVKKKKKKKKQVEVEE